MAHGYLGDGYGSHGDVDSDRDEHERERHSRERGWRGSDDWRDRNHDRDRGMMFGSGRERGWSSDDDDRPNDRMWSDHDRHRGQGWSSEDREQRSYGSTFGGRERGDWDHSSNRQAQRFSANRDDHYRSWRDQRMSELDRDYADYCREREQQFHREFDDWRSKRHGNQEPLRTGMTQTGMSHDPSGELELTQEASEGTNEPNAMSNATLGTTSAPSRKR